MGSIKAFISFVNEHGIFAKEEVIEKFSNAKFVTIRYPETNKYSIEKLFNSSEINPNEESKMLLSLFDCLATHHYYFPSEYEFTENIEWKPRQYEFLAEVNDYFKLNKNRREYKSFKKLYSKIEKSFINYVMNIRSTGHEPSDIYRGDAELQEYVENISKFLENYLIQAYNKADVVLGCGTFLTLTDYPINLAYQYSGIDIGHGGYTSKPKYITVNPFIFYWTITNFFRLHKSEVRPECISIELFELPEEVALIDATKLKVRAYSPSEIVSKTPIARRGAEIVKESLSKLSNINPLYSRVNFLCHLLHPALYWKLKLTKIIKLHHSLIQHLMEYVFMRNSDFQR